MNFKIKLFIYIFFIINISLFSEDYSEIDFKYDTVELRCCADFYWDQIIYPTDAFPESSKKVTFPYDWSTDPDCSEWGEGTFKTTIKVPRENYKLGIKLFYTFNSIRLFVNGDLALEYGIKNGENIESHQRQGSVIVELPDTEEIELIFHVYNYDDNFGGILKAPEIGRYDILSKNQNSTIIFEAFLFGMLLITGMLYCSFYISKKDDPSALFFGLFAIVLAFRTALYGEHIFARILSDFPQELEATLGHLTFYLAIPLFIKFIAEAYTFRRSKIMVYGISIVSSIYIVLAITTPHSFYIQFLSIYQIISMLCTFFAVYIIIKRAIKGNQDAIVTLCGLTVLVLAAINDILFSQQIVTTFHMTPAGMIIFVMSQALLLSWNIAKAFSKSEKLAEELTFANISFKRFVPEEFLKILDRTQVSEVVLGDHTQLEMTIMFCDIRDFTTLSEKMSPKENFMFINSFLERIGPVIRKNGGFIDKYMGDGIMSLFPGGADTAIDAALSMLDELEVYNKHRGNSGYDSINLGIGINTGSLMLGTIGENERMDGTVISDAVNICSRIESITKEYGLSIAISEETYLSLKDKERLEVRNIGKILLKGKKKVVSVFELFSHNLPEIVKLKKEFRPAFESAIELYEHSHFSDAKKIFEEILAKFPEDFTCKSYIEKINFNLNLV
ncbi:MAG: adenylate/guanylate cyclase domain-containing protein [Spirochaetaceae bacterium]